MNGKKKVYLAHNFAAREFLATVVKPWLESLGHTVTSSWLTDDRHLLPNSSEYSAVEDLKDIDKADTLIFFAEQFGLSAGRSKYIELGYAIRGGKLVIIVGGNLNPGCVFYALPTLRHVERYEEVLQYL
jgi:nucleoside 2-deoxyribosyltransferase